MFTAKHASTMELLALQSTVKHVRDGTLRPHISTMQVLTHFRRKLSMTHITTVAYTMTIASRGVIL